MRAVSSEASNRMTSFCFLFEVVAKKMKDQVICECFSGRGREMRSLRGFDTVFFLLLSCRMNQWDTFPRAALASCIWICPTQRSPTGRCDSCPGNAVAVRPKCGLTCDFRLALNACSLSSDWHRVYYSCHTEILSTRLWLVLVGFRDSPPSSAPSHGGMMREQLLSGPRACVCAVLPEQAWLTTGLLFQPVTLPLL